MALLRIDGLSKTFLLHRVNRRVQGCQDIDFAIEPGQFVGITGRSGSAWACFQSFPTMIHTVVPPPSRNISVPSPPKKYMGERPKWDMKRTVIKSR